MFKERKYIIGYILAILAIVLGLFVTIYGFNDTKLKNISYNEEGSKVNYKVYLKENNYFNDKYLGEGETYIASLIDYINIKYPSFKFNFFTIESDDNRFSLLNTIIDYIKEEILNDKDKMEE